MLLVFGSLALRIYLLSISEDDVESKTEDGEKDANDCKYLNDDHQWEGNSRDDI